MLSSLDESAGQESFERVELSDIAAETVASLTRKADENNVTLQLSAERVKMNANRSLMHEMLYNLIDNAIKYNRPGGRVTVDIRSADNRINLSVSDNKKARNPYGYRLFAGREVQPKYESVRCAALSAAIRRWWRYAGW